MTFRFLPLAATLALLTAVLTLGANSGKAATPKQDNPAITITTGSHTLDTYSGALDLAIAGMEEGKHIQALGPLRTALEIDRNEPYGVIALGTLYLHAGSPARAAREFARARALAPDEPLAQWGAALAALQGGTRDAKAFDAISAEAVPAAPTLATYVRLLDGPATDVATATKSVDATETDPLKLEVAGFAALRAGDFERGTALLKALMARPDMKILTEDRAVVLPFQTSRPAEGEAPTLPDGIGFPEPTGGYALTGIVSISPPNGVPSGTTLITYTTSGGGGFNATTNASPFSAQWNTANYPNGLYTLHIVATGEGGRVLSDTRQTVTLSNANAPASKLLTDDERKDFSHRLLQLLTPRVCKKAAHYALAARAKIDGNREDEQNESEAVVAIDPGFGDSMKTLRELHQDLIAHPENWWRGITTEKIVALTFDDGPNPAPSHTPALLSALEREKVIGTFFVVGARAEQNVPLLQRMTKDGDEIANHSYSHANLTYLDHAAMERELCRTSVIVREATGQRPLFYRPPGGNYNKAVVEAAGALGMAGAYWTVDGASIETGPFPPEKLVKYILAHVQPGAIILMHNAPENTIAALPAIIAGLRARGYEMVTMSELARRCSQGSTGGKNETGGHVAGDAMNLH